MPDIAFADTNKDYYELTRGGHDLIRITSDGLASLTNGGLITAHCKVNLKYMPFDTQTCEFTLGSWKSTMETQIVKVKEPGFHTLNLTQSGEWEILATEAYVKSSLYSIASSFSEVDLRLTIKRKGGFHIVNVVVPSSIIAIVEAATFAIPVASVDRLGVSLTCLLAYSFFQNVLSDSLPRDNDSVPLILLYIVCMMAYIVFAIVIQSIGIFLSDNKRQERIPKFLKPVDHNFGTKCIHRFDTIGLILYILFILLTPVVMLIIYPNYF